MTTAHSRTRARETASNMVLRRSGPNLIGGLKVMAENGWFAARPSGTENIYRIYAESFRGPDHLRRILGEAQTIVSDSLAQAPDSREKL